MCTLTEELVEKGEDSKLEVRVRVRVRVYRRTC
jgi:hypothetical protein